MRQELTNKLNHAVTAYDARMSANPKRQQSIYALGHYLTAVERCLDKVEAGATLRDAMFTSFNGQLLNVCLRAAGEAKATKEEVKNYNRKNMRALGF